MGGEYGRQGGDPPPSFFDETEFTGSGGENIMTTEFHEDIDVMLWDALDRA